MSTTTVEELTLADTPPTDWNYEKLPARHMPHQGGDPRTGLTQIRAIIEHAILNQPRSLQKTIGPSEIGTECEHCLAAKLAGWEQKEQTVPWLPFIGTSVHAMIEDIFARHEISRNALHTTGLRYLAERRTMVGHIDGQQIWGSTDLVDTVTGMTVDWKIVGATTLRKAKTGPSKVYRIQQHLYAKGWNDAGTRIDHVGIAYLPRNAVSLAQAVWWTEPYDRAIAQTALDRATATAVNIRAMASISGEVLDSWIAGLDRHPDCWDCNRFADSPQASPPDSGGDPSAQFLGIK